MRSKKIIIIIIWLITCLVKEKNIKNGNLNYEKGCTEDNVN